MVKKLEDNDNKVRICKGVTLKGLPCKNKISLKYSYCFFHAGQYYHNEVTTKNCMGFTKLGLPCKKTIGTHIKSDFCVFHKKPKTCASDVEKNIKPLKKKDLSGGFSITKGKAFLEASGVSKAIKKKSSKPKKGDEDDDIFIYPQKRDYKPGDTTDEDIFEFVRKYKQDNNLPKKDPDD